VEAWDDLRVNPSSIPEIGATSPEKVIYKTDGSATSGHAVEFDGINQYGKVLDYSDLDSSGNYTIEIWLKPNNDIAPILYRDGYFEIDKNYDSLVVSIANSWQIWVNNTLINNSPTYIAITVKISGSNSIVKIYVNGVKKKRVKLWGYTLGAASSDLLIATDSEDYYEGIIDSLTLYNITLSDTQITERYNSGAGSVSYPSGVTESTDVIANFQFEEGSGNTVDNDCTLGAGHDMTLYNSPTWVDGLVNTSSSFGIVSWAFAPGVRNELFFSRQLPHSYKEGSYLNPHIHWTIPEDKTGNVVWGLEYTWASIGHLFGDTTVNEVVTPVWGKDIHAVTSFSDIIGTNQEISSIIICRLYRDGNNALDTYSGNVYLFEFDFHYEIDYIGSMSTWSKQG